MYSVEGGWLQSILEVLSHMSVGAVENTYWCSFLFDCQPEAALSSLPDILKALEIS